MPHPSATAATARGRHRSPAIVSLGVHRGRWLVAGLLFLVTVINYVDRQVFSILAPDLQDEIGWSELDYGRIVIAFQVSYAAMTLAAGRLLDRIRHPAGICAGGGGVVAGRHGSRAGAFPRSALASPASCSGVTEAANFPAAVKTVAERFPASERAMATGIFNSGVAAGTLSSPRSRCR